MRDRDVRYLYYIFLFLVLLGGIYIGFFTKHKKVDKVEKSSSIVD